jgi:hypothetical protein
MHSLAAPGVLNSTLSLLPSPSLTHPQMADYEEEDEIPEEVKKRLMALKGGLD